MGARRLVVVSMGIVALAASGVSAQAPIGFPAPVTVYSPVVPVVTGVPQVTYYAPTAPIVAAPAVTPIVAGYAPTVAYQPAVPVISGYSPVTTYYGSTSYYGSAYPGATVADTIPQLPGSAGVAAPMAAVPSFATTPVYAAAPVYAAPVVASPVLTAPVVVGRPVIVHPKYYVPGQPVRNFFRAVTP